MTASQRLDREVVGLLDELAAPSYPDYIEDVLARAVRDPQRPSWTFPARWIPMDVVARRPVPVPGIPWRIAGLVILALLAASAILAVGAQRHAAPPFGLARNGAVAYAVDGTIYSRDLETGQQRTLVSGPGFAAPHFSPDGTKLAYLQVADGAADRLLVADADGSHPREVFGSADLAWWDWAPGGDRLGVLTMPASGASTLSIVDAAGSSAPRPLALGDVRALDVAGWLPPDGRRILVLGRQGLGDEKLYAVDVEDGTPTPLSGALTGVIGPLSVTPDGRTALFSTYDQSVIRMYVLDLATNQVRPYGGALPEPSGGLGAGTPSIGQAIVSPDGTHIVFGRYWDEHDSTINHQVTVASIASDGADAVPIGDVMRLPSGHKPFEFAFSPDGKRLLVWFEADGRAWLGDPTTGIGKDLPWGALSDPPDWQRTAP